LIALINFILSQVMKLPCLNTILLMPQLSVIILDDFTISNVFMRLIFNTQLIHRSLGIFSQYFECDKAFKVRKELNLQERLKNSC